MKLTAIDNEEGKKILDVSIEEAIERLREFVKGREVEVVDIDTSQKRLFAFFVDV